MQKEIPNYIRMFAAMMVFAVHYSIIILDDKFVKLGEILGNGGNGPAIFFVLSGYLTWQSMNKNRYTTKQFFKRRFFRLAPIYYLVLLFQMLFREMPRDIMGLGWLRYFLFINAIIPSENHLWNNIDGYWSMSSFALFYLLAPILYRIIKISLNKAVLMLGILWLISRILENIIFVSLPPGFPMLYLYLFMIGIVVYCAMEERKQGECALSCLVGLIGLLMLSKRNYFTWGLITALILLCGSFSTKEAVIKPGIDRVVSRGVISATQFIWYICRF